MLEMPGLGENEVSRILVETDSRVWDIFRLRHFVRQRICCGPGVWADSSRTARGIDDRRSLLYRFLRDSN